MTAFTLETAAQVLQEVMPGSVRGLGIDVTELAEGKAVLRMPCTDAACREGGVFGGQAIVAMADTAMCFALWTDGRGRRPVATVDLHVTFMRAISGESLLATAEIVRSGRTLSFARVQIMGEKSGHLAATGIGTFAWPA